MSRSITKPTTWLCAQRRLRSAWASAQSDQNHHRPHEEALGPKLPIKCKAKTLIRSDWADAQADLSLRWAHRTFCWFCHVAAQIFLLHVIDPYSKISWNYHNITILEPSHEDFSSSVTSFFKCTCAAIQWAYCRCLIFGWTLHLLQYFMYANRESSGETALMRRVAWAFAGRLCDKYHNLMSWLPYFSDRHGQANSVALEQTAPRVYTLLFHLHL